MPDGYTSCRNGNKVVLNVALIPSMGYMGCAVAFLVSSIVMVGLCYYLGEKHYPVPYDVQSALGYILSGGLLIFLAAHIPISNAWVATLYHMALFVLYIGIVVLAEWRTFGPVLDRWRNKRARGVVSSEVGPNP